MEKERERERERSMRKKEKKEQTSATVDACKISSKVVVEMLKFEGEVQLEQGRTGKVILAQERTQASLLLYELTKYRSVQVCFIG